MNLQRRGLSNKVKQRQIQTKFLEQQTKKMQQRLSQLKKQVQQQRNIKEANNFESTVSRWKKSTRSDAPLKSYAKQVLQEQKQAYKKFGINEKKITGTKTFVNIKKKIKEEKQFQQQQKQLTKIPTLMYTAKQKHEEQKSPQQKIQAIQNNFFKAKMDTKNLIKEKTVLQFLEQIFLQQYFPLFQENGFNQLDDLRYATRQKLQQMNISKGHQIKIVKKIKQQFNKGVKNNSEIFQNDSNYLSKEKYKENEEKTLVQMGYGDGNINEYTHLQAQQNQLQKLQNNFQEADSQNVSENQENDIVLITVPLSQFALQTGEGNQEQDQLSQSIAENCFNCYRLIPLKKQLFKSLDNRNFCSNNCLGIYKLSMEKKCPQCGSNFFKTNGYYQEGMWFCSIQCCPNKNQIQEMFFQWAKANKK